MIHSFASHQSVAYADWLLTSPELRHYDRIYHYTTSPWSANVSSLKGTSLHLELLKGAQVWTRAPARPNDSDERVSPVQFSSVQLLQFKRSPCQTVALLQRVQ